MLSEPIGTGAPAGAAAVKGTAIWQEMEAQLLPETLPKAETEGEKYPRFSPPSPSNSSANTSLWPNQPRRDYGI